MTKRGCGLPGKNRFRVGDEVELIGPQMRQARFTVDEIADFEGTILPAGQPNSQLRMKLPDWAEAGDLLRLKQVKSALN